MCITALLSNGHTVTELHVGVRSHIVNSRIVVHSVSEFLRSGFLFFLAVILSILIVLLILHRGLQFVHRISSGFVFRIFFSL